MALPAQPEPLPAWRTIQSELRGGSGTRPMGSGSRRSRLHSWDGDVLVLEAPAATRAWAADRFGRVIDRCVKDVLGRAGVGVVHGRRSAARRATRAPDAAPEPRFNPRHSFEQFVIGAGNRLAHAAALAVAEIPGQAYNPLFLHAPPGLGKTHLLHAIGNYVLAFGAGTSVRYATAESFTNHFIAALDAKSLTSFKLVYRDADVLLIDDVQFLASKSAPKRSSSTRSTRSTRRGASSC